MTKPGGWQCLAPGSRPNHPPMFIECLWNGAEVMEMLRKHDFSSWHAQPCCYVNRFNDNDPLQERLKFNGWAKWIVGHTGAVGTYDMGIRKANIGSE
jgi:uncharacterized protein YfaT (DUF1175 family)